MKILLWLMAGFALSAQATPPGLQPVPDGAPTAPKIEPLATTPNVTTRRQKDTIIKEYREGGKIQMVEIIPPVGPSYIMTDQDGDGAFEPVVDEDRQSLPNAGWLIHSW